VLVGVGGAAISPEPDTVRRSRSAKERR
jgi:hypothetical protein